MTWMEYICSPFPWALLVIGLFFAVGAYAMIYGSSGKP